jgi:hypothetical protein
MDETIGEWRREARAWCATEAAEVANHHPDTQTARTIDGSDA